MLTFREQKESLLCIALAMIGLMGCASKSDWQDPGLSYEPKAFKQILKTRVPELSEKQVVAPFEVPRDARALARKKLNEAPAGLNPVQILVSALTDPKPEGLGIEYDWAASGTAAQTLQIGKGDCVSLAMVLVGLGRGLGWPIYFAEARPEQPVTHEFIELTVLSSHMIVIVLTQEGPVMIDFLGLIDKTAYEIHPIDDLNAYAHLINNIAGHQIVSNASVDRQMWELAQQSFRLVTQIQPDLGRGWNNLGIAYTRLDQFDKARLAYNKAMELETVFGSPSRNLTIMETRASGKPSVTLRALSGE
ncbi:MAG: tetratricopeptide repeat protein [Pseudomonadales bacterium]|nr:tetratricopeptide repeat protein [Pseudomonadales bacterium]